MSDHGLGNEIPVVVGPAGEATELFEVTETEEVVVLSGELETALPFIAGPPPPPPGPGESTPTVGAAQTSGSRQGAKLHHGVSALRGPLADGAAVIKAGARDLGARSPWILGAAAILFAFTVSWFSYFLASLRHARGLNAQARILEFFSPGTFLWAGAVLLAVALVAAGRRFDIGATAPGLFNDFVTAAAFLAACAVGVCALIDCLVELTNFGHGIDAALSGLVGSIAVLPVAAAAAWWGHRLHNRTG